MCGRYALALRPAQIRQMLQDDNMPVYDAPPDYDDGHDGAAANDGHDAGPPPPSPRQTYNFAPGYHGIVYRADVPDWGAGPRRQRQRTGGAPPTTDADGEDDAPGPKPAGEVRYKLQAMKWGLVPFWTKKPSGYGAAMKTINCRDDSLAQGGGGGGGGMWAPMKARKRCVVVAQGFYEWLHKDRDRDKVPHFVRRADGRLMCFAGLWDVVVYDDDDERRKNYTYTIITTESNKQLSFLHDRMPVILENGSEALRTWLDPGRYEWSKELQALLRPFDGELDVYPVTKDVGKVGNNSPSFIVPVDSAENKNNIANFFARGAAAAKTESLSMGKAPPAPQMNSDQQPGIKTTKDEGFVEADGKGDGGFAAGKATPTRKRKVDDEDEIPADQDLPLSSPSAKKAAVAPSLHFSPAKGGSGVKKPKTISSTSNTKGKSGGGGGAAAVKKSPAAAAAVARGKPKQRKGQQEPATQKKITGFFANSS